jgi:hypothetical protein
MTATRGRPSIIDERLTNLPVGTYTVTFTLEGFAKQQRSDGEARRCQDRPP